MHTSNEGKINKKKTQFWHMEKKSDKKVKFQKYDNKQFDS